MAKDINPAKDQTVATVDKSTGEITSAFGFDPSKAQVKKRVTLPVLKQEEGKTNYVTFLTPMYLGKEVQKTREGEKEKPATLAIVMDLLSGLPHTLVMSTVQVSNIKESYADKSYVGKSFQLILHAVKQGKKYRQVSVNEIDTPASLNVAKEQSSIVMPEPDAVDAIHGARMNTTGDKSESAE